MASFVSGTSEAQMELHFHFRDTLSDKQDSGRLLLDLQHLERNGFNREPSEKRGLDEPSVSQALARCSRGRIAKKKISQRGEIISLAL